MPPVGFLTSKRLAPLALVTVLLTGCAQSELSREQAIRASGEAARHLAHGRLSVRRVLKRKTRNGGEEVWFIRFAIIPRDHICAVSWSSQTAYYLDVPDVALVYYLVQPVGRRIWAAVGACADVEAVVVR